MANTNLHLYEEPPGERSQVDCVEIYLPKSIEFLSELYQLLREKVTNRLGRIGLDGFSIYEVDGVFRGEKLWEQRTLVIRLMFRRDLDRTATAVEGRITEIGRELAVRVASNEEEIWICHYPETLRVFRGVKKFLQ